VKRALLNLEKVAATAALVPVAVAFGVGVIVWGVARDLQRTRIARNATVRRALVWFAGDIRDERLASRC
jgi:di/tricarboxylate transporter